MYTSQTEQFPVMSSQENRYIMVLCKTDRNLILVKPRKNRTSSKMCKAYNTFMNWLKQSGITVKKHILDNEASEEFLQTIKQQGIKYQKVPPHMHHQNVAEKAISTFKDHFTAILARVDKNFPMHLGQVTTPGREHIKHITNNKYCTQHFGICLHVWTTQLQQNTPSTLGMHNAHTQYTFNENNMGKPCQWRVLHQNIKRAL